MQITMSGIAEITSGVTSLGWALKIEKFTPFPSFKKALKVF